MSLLKLDNCPVQKMEIQINAIFAQTLIRFFPNIFQ